MQFFRNAIRLSTTFALAAALGCTSSPTEPSGGGGVITPKPPDPVVSFVVTVTANPSQITAGGTGSSNITVDVRRTDNGQPPPDLTPVTLTTNLGGFGAVGGPQSVQLQLLNGRAQAVLFAGAEAGTATVRAQLAGGAGAANVIIGQPATFFVSSVDPNIGSPQGGEQVTILGGGFEQPVRVTFNGAAATVRSVSPGRIVVTTPSAAAAGVDVGVGETESVSVTVTINVNEVNQDSDTIERGFTYTLGGGTTQPQVFSVNPASGSNDGGTEVVIRGEGFQSPVQVFFGLGADASSFNGVEATLVSVTPTQIVAVTPPARGFGQNLTNQVVDVLVKNVNTGFSTIGRQQFKYGVDVLITAMGPGSGPFTGGTVVTISGQGFDEPVAVTLGGIGQAVRSVSGTQVVFVTSGITLSQCPSNGIVPATGVTVTNIETGDSDDANLTFNFIVPLPQIFGISPGSGSPGITATISGQNFAPNVQVLFGDAVNGSSAAILSVSPTAISVRVPSAPQGFTFITEPCDGNGDGIPGGTRLVPTPISITVRNLDGTGCASTLTNAFVLNPPNTTCSGDTSTPPPPPVTQCNDGFDNDGDTLIDAADPQCTGPSDNSEAT
jgi:IPT/TIG domain-containing protein